MAGGSLAASRKAAPSGLDAKLRGNVDDPGRADVLAGCGGGAEIARGGAAETGAATAEDAGPDAEEILTAPVPAAARGAAARFWTRSSKLRRTDTFRSWFTRHLGPIVRGAVERAPRPTKAPIQATAALFRRHAG